MPEWAKAAGLLGSLFVGALKAVAPLLDLHNPPRNFSALRVKTQFESG